MTKTSMMNRLNRKITSSGIDKSYSRLIFLGYVLLNDLCFHENAIQWLLIYLFYFDSGRLAGDLNAEQKLAVRNIVQAVNKPVPYLLFGPAGDCTLFFIV